MKGKKSLEIRAGNQNVRATLHPIMRVWNSTQVEILMMQVAPVSAEMRNRNGILLTDSAIATTVEEIHAY